MRANAAFIITTDTAGALIGSFNTIAVGETYAPVNFIGLLPGTNPSQRIGTNILSGSDPKAIFSTPTDGTPNDPHAQCLVSTGCGSATGSYSNNPNGVDVFFEISNLDFDGTTFTGDFSFTTVVPIPAAAWLFGSALLTLAGIKRRKAAA